MAGRTRSLNGTEQFYEPVPSCLSVTDFELDDRVLLFTILSITGVACFIVIVSTINSTTMIDPGAPLYDAQSGFIKDIGNSFPLLMASGFGIVITSICVLVAYSSQSSR